MNTLRYIALAAVAAYLLARALLSRENYTGNGEVPMDARGREALA